MKPIVCDKERWPVVFWVFSGNQTDEDMRYYFENLTEIYRRKTRFSTITLMRKFSVNRQHLGQIADWIKKNRQEVSERLVSNSMVSTLLSFRFVLSSLMLLQPSATPYQVVPSLEEAIPWTVQHLRAAGLKAPEDLSAYSQQLISGS